MKKSSNNATILDQLYLIIENRPVFFELLSQPALQIMGKFWQSAYEDFAEKCESLDQLSEPTREAIRRQLFSLHLEAGYFLWMAEELAADRSLEASAVESTDQLGFPEGQEKMALDKYQMPEGVSQALLDFSHNVLENNFPSEFPDIKAAPQALRDQLQKALLQLATATYQLAREESVFRK